MSLCWPGQDGAQCIENDDTEVLRPSTASDRAEECNNEEMNLPVGVVLLVLLVCVLCPIAGLCVIITSLVRFCKGRDQVHAVDSNGNILRTQTIYSSGGGK